MEENLRIKSARPDDFRQAAGPSTRRKIDSEQRIQTVERESERGERVYIRTKIFSLVIKITF